MLNAPFHMAFEIKHRGGGERRVGLAGWPIGGRKDEKMGRKEWEWVGIKFTR